MTTASTLTWFINETARGFVRAMGKHRTRLREKIDSDAISIRVHVVWSEDAEVMRSRAARAGRALADEAKRRRLRYFAPQPLVYQFGTLCSRAESAHYGIAMRAVLQWQPQDVLLRVDMRGARGPHKNPNAEA